MRVTKDQAANCTAFFTGETAIDTERQARQCLLKTSSRISGHVVAGVNCRTPHRRIVTNAFTLPRRSRTVSSSASNTSGCAAAIFSTSVVEGVICARFSARLQLWLPLSSKVYSYVPISTTPPALPNVNAASPPPVVTSVRLSPAAGLAPVSVTNILKSPVA